MKKTLFLLLIFLFFSWAKAQVKPIYFIKDSIVVTNKNIATSYGIYGKLSGQDLWTFKKYNLFDELILTGTYEDEKLTIPHGEFVYYQSIYDYNDDDYNEGTFSAKKKSIYLFQKGEFKHGLKEGIWKEYFPNGALRSVINYKKNEFDGDMKIYNRKGKLKVLGFFLNGTKVGNWIDLDSRTSTFYKNDEKISEVIIDDKLIKEYRKLD